MNTASLRSPTVRRTVELINQEKLDDFMALFALDATLVDVLTYYGHQEIREWAQRETFGTHLRFQVERETNAEGTIIEGEVRSVGGYNGPARFTFTLGGELIVQLMIT